VGHTGSPLDEPAKTLKAGVHGVPGGENMLADLTVRSAISQFEKAHDCKRFLIHSYFLIHGQRA
jgi:hypothetical protein